MKRILDLQRGSGGRLILDRQNVVADQVESPPEGQTITDEDYEAWLDSDDAIPNLLVRATALVNGVPTIFRWSTMGVTFGGATAPVFYDPIVSTGIPYSESLSWNGGATVTAGDLEIDNANGVNEHLLEYDWWKQPLEVLKGDLRWNEADYRRRYKGVSGGMSHKNDRTLALYQLDMMERLNTAITTHRLGGTGPNQDAIIPLAFGECPNVTGLLTDEASLRRAFHDGPIEAVRMRTNGLPTFDFDVDYSAGTVDLSVDNQGAAITASIQGDKFGGVYRNTIASIVRRIVTGFGDPEQRYTDADIDLANFAAFEAAHPEPVGDYSDDGPNILDVCDRLASSVGAQLSPSIDGKLRLIQIAIPAAGTSTNILPEHILLGSLRLVEHIPRVEGITLGYCRNYTVQDSLLRDGAIPDEHLELFRRQWRTVTVGAGNPKQKNTQLLRLADAAPQGERDFALWGVDRAVYEFTGLAPMTKLKLGQPAKIFNDLFNMKEGREAQVLFLAPDPDERKRRVTVRIIV
jgi:hypothetical protein